MTSAWNRMARVSGAALGAVLLTGAALAQDTQREVIVFQPEATAGALPLAMITRPDAGKAATFTETDEAGAARALAGAKGPALVYKAAGPHVQASAAAKAGAASLVPGASGAPQTYYLFAHLEPGEGKDKVFNDFYNATHQPEVLMIPGMQWSVRGELSSQKPASFGAPRYFAVYEFKSYDLKATMAEFDRRMKEKVITPFPEGATGRNILVYWAGPAAAHSHQH